jgi:hypothetical protein
MAANFAAENGLATIVGKKTAGNVLGGDELQGWRRLLVTAAHLWLVHVAGPMR